MATPTDKLISSLWDPLIQNDSVKLAEVIQPIPSLLEAGNVDPDPLISPMIRLLGSHNAEIKEHVCAFLLKLPANLLGDVGVLAQNILIQDTKDANPRIRSVAISTLCSLPSGNPDHSLPTIQRCLRDSHPLVRKAAVTGTGKFGLQHPSFLKESGLIDNLYAIIKDPEPTVLTFALQTLNVLLKDEGGIVIPRSMGTYLLGRLSDFPELEFCFVMDYLLKYYAIKREDESSYLMNALDSFLDSNNGPIFLSSAKVFLKAIPKDSIALRKDFITRISPQLCRFLRKSSIAFDVMEFIALLGYLGEPEALIISKELRFKSKDSPELLLAKVRLLSKTIRGFASNDIAKEIDAYLLKFCLTSGHPEVERELIESLCDAPRPEFVQKLEKSLSCSRELGGMRLFSPVCELIRKIIHHNGPVMRILTCICTLSKNMKSFSGREANNLIWILRHHSRDWAEAPYFLEMLWNQRRDELSKLGLTSLFLSAAIRVFLHHPLASQMTLGIIFEGVYNSQPDLREQVDFYIKLTQSQSLMKKISA